MWSTEPPPGALHGLGGFLLAIDRLEAAERPLLAAAAAHPGFWEPHLDLGVLYQRRGLPGPALQSFRTPTPSPRPPRAVRPHEHASAKSKPVELTSSKVRRHAEPGCRRAYGALMRPQSQANAASEQ